MARKPLTKKIRFEVFKRDAFKCQYCGKSSPDVILEIDHIEPVASGGTNDSINLVTACFDCNRGKGKRKLSNNKQATLEKDELEKLKLRKEQMDLYVEWKKSLVSIQEIEFQKLNDLLGVVNMHFNDNGKKNVLKYLKKYGFKECYDALEICIEQYEPNLIGERLPKVLSSIRNMENNPHLKDVYYIRAIVKNRMYCNEWQAKQMIEDAILMGYNVEKLKDIAKKEPNWTSWRVKMEELLNG